MELWAARDRSGSANIFNCKPVISDTGSTWRKPDNGDDYLYQEMLCDLACRGVKPGEKRKLKTFDPINEIVEYEDTLEQRHQRLVDAVTGLSKNYELMPARIVFLEDFYLFLRSEGYIN